MTLLYVVCAVLTCVIVYQGVLLYLLKKEHTKSLQMFTECWHKERSELLDRIQAPTFDHYKQAEVRVIKAQKEEPEKPVQLL